jgi:adenosylhomocysteine nucleosidase
LIYLVTALFSEARPLIEYYDLKHDHQSLKISLYKSDDVVLVVGGLGKIKTAVSTGIALSKEEDTGRVVIANIGIAGAPGNYEIGHLCLVNQIVDESTQRSYYPDIFVKHSLKEEKLVTVDKPHLNGEVGDYMVDMEASGFFEAANVYLPPSQIGCLKVVSDHKKNVKLTRELVSELIRNRMQEMDEYLRSWHSLITDQEKEVLNIDDRQLIVSLKDHLHLTATQFRQLEKLATKYKNEADNLDILRGFQELKARTKNERNGIFERIRTVLR